MSTIEDPRKTGLKEGLRQLNRAQLQRVIDYPGEMVLDEYNYEDGKFCPLAIGIGLDLWKRWSYEEPSHDVVFDILEDLGYRVYNTRGVAGSFYREDRKGDLLIAAREVMEEFCQTTLDCGGVCKWRAIHSPPCLCVGDVDGVPNTCPA